MKFSKDNIIDLFGLDESSQEEDRRFDQYFIRSSPYEDSVSKQNIVILVGHKGSGKSSILKKSHNDLSKSQMSISLDPTSILAGSTDLNQENYSAVVAHWQERLQKIIAEEILINKFSLPNQARNIRKIGMAATGLAKYINDALRTSDRSKLSHFDDTIIENV